MYKINPVFSHSVCFLLQKFFLQEKLLILLTCRTSTLPSVINRVHPVFFLETFYKNILVTKSGAISNFLDAQKRAFQ